MRSGRYLAAAGVALLGLGAPSGGAAQETVTEEVDATRLDAERLPPEAIEVSRDLYSHGIFLEGSVGGRGFIGGVGDLSRPGFFGSLGGGLEIFRWLWVGARLELSFHATNAPPPPTDTAFEVVSAIAEARLQVDFGARFAMWLGGEVGLVATTGNALPLYGLADADALGLIYGGSLGLDWHLVNIHYSVGLAFGARLYPSLAAADGGAVIGPHGALYLRYVF